MDISTQGLTQVAINLQNNRTSQDVQVAVLKKALNSEQAAAAALLQMLPPLPGELPLAASGSMGTQVNVMA